MFEGCAALKELGLGALDDQTRADLYAASGAPAEIAGLFGCGGEEPLA
jgi:hypothetical protein